MFLIISIFSTISLFLFAIQMFLPVKTETKLINVVETKPHNAIFIQILVDNNNRTTCFSLYTFIVSHSIKLSYYNLKNDIILTMYDTIGNFILSFVCPYSFMEFFCPIYKWEESAKITFWNKVSTVNYGCQLSCSINAHLDGIVNGPVVKFLRISAIVNVSYTFHCKK